MLINRTGRLSEVSITRSVVVAAVLVTLGAQFNSASAQVAPTEVTSLEHDIIQGGDNSIVKIDSDTYAVAYKGDLNKGFITTFTISADGTTITEVASLEHDAVAGKEQSLIQVDADTYVLAYKGLDNDGYIKTFTISADGVTITEVTSLEHDIIQGGDNSIVKIDSDTYAVAYKGDLNKGFITTFTISADGTTITEVASLEHDAVAGKEQSLIQVDADTYVLAYKGLDNDGYIKTFTISADGVTITEVTSLEHDTDNSQNNSLVQVDADTYALAYAGLDSDGYIKTFTISADGVTITEVASLEHDIVQGKNNSFVKVDADTYALAYKGLDNDGYIKTFTISADGVTITEVASLEHDTVQGTENSFVQVDADTYALAYKGLDNDGYLSTFTIPASGATITEVATLEHDTLNSQRPSLVQVKSDTYLLAHAGNGTLGYIKRIYISADGATITEIGSLEHDTVAGKDNALVQVDADTYALAYKGLDNDGYIKTFNVDITGPTPAIATTESSPSNANPVPFTINFGEAIATASFDLTDITVSSGTKQNLVNTGDDQNYTFEVASPTDGSTLTVSIAADQLTDVATNDNFVSNTVNLTIDRTGPTPTVATTETSPSNADPVLFTIDFGEAIATGTFDLTDITVSSGTKQNLVNTGDDQNYTFEVASPTDGVTLTVSIPATGLTDVAGNNNLVSNTVNLDIDRTGPTPAVATTETSPSKADPVPFTINFGEAIATGTFDPTDITVSSGTKQNLVNTGDDQNYTFEVASPTDGATLTVSIPAAGLTDVAGNNNLVSNTVNLDIDRTPPVAPVVTQPASPTTDTTPVISGTASEEGGTITLTSDQDGVLAPTGTVVAGAWSITLTTELTQNTHSITATHTDAAGNVSPVSGGKTLVVDLPPTPAIATTETSPSKADPVPFTIDFGEAIDTGTFDLTDITVSSGTKQNLVNTGDDQNYTFEVASPTDGATLTVSIAAGQLKDLAALDNLVSNTVNLDIDRTGPTPVVATSETSPSSADPVGFTINFGETIDTGSFALTDITVSSGTKQNLVNTGDDIHFTFEVASPTDGATLTVSIPAAGLTDVAGNNNLVSNTVNLDIDRTAPTPAIATTETSPSNADPVPFTINFGETIDTGSFALSDITVSSGTKQNLVNTGDNQNYTFEVASPTDGATLTVSIAAGVLTDVAGNNNLVSNTVNLTIDRTGPTPAVATTETSPSKANPVPFTIDFGEAIATGTFDLTDITVSSGTKQNLVNTGDDQNYTFEVASSTDGATLTASIAADLLTDVAGNNNLVSNTVNLDIDRTAPSAPVVTQPATPTDDTTPVISGTAGENGGTITLSSDQDGVLAPTGTVVGGVWSISLTTSLTINTHSITATHTDAAGNVSPVSGGKTLVIIAATTNSYRSKATGNWSAIATWDRYNGAAWVNAAAYPTDATAETITLRTGYNVTADVAINIDQTVIESGATFTVAQDAIILDGAGVDLEVSGTVHQTGPKQISVRGSSTVIFTATSVLDIDDGFAEFRGTSSTTFQNGAQITIDTDPAEIWAYESGVVTFEEGVTITSNGWFSNYGNSVMNLAGTLTNNGETWMDEDGIFNLQSTGQIINNGDYNTNDAAVINVQGTFTNNGTINITGPTTANTFDILNGGVFEHGQNGGALPDITQTTWQAGSTMLISGVTTTLPTGMNDSYSNVTWNSTGQTAALDLNAVWGALGGNLTINSTGSSTLSWVQNVGTALSVGGGYTQTAGTFIYADGTGSGTMSVVGNASLTGGTLTLSGGAGTPTLDLDGNLTVNGGAINETSTGSGTILLSGGSTQSVTASSGISDTIDLTVNNTGGIILQATLVAPRHVTGTAGTINLNSNDLNVGGDLTINSDLTNPAAITFDGTTLQNFTYAPGTLSLPELVLDNATGSLLMGTALTITTTASVRAGTWTINGQTVTFPTGTTLYNAGTLTGDIIFKRYYGQDSDGWRMIATPLDGVNYSSLNAPFHTQGAVWADYIGGVGNLQSLNFAIQDWVEIDGADAAFSGSEGYIFYMYEDDPFATPILPTTWTVTGSVRTLSPRALTWNTTPADSYNYVGNPSAGNLDWDAVAAAGTNLGTTYATWDPALTTGGGLTGYKYYNSASGIGDAGRYIAPFTAFMAQPTAAAGQITFPTSEAANAQSANYFGKGRGMSSHIRLQIEGEGLAEAETYILFDDAAEDFSDYSDPFDVNRLRPLSGDFVTMWFPTGDRYLAFDGRSFHDGAQKYDISLTASREGSYELTWPLFHQIPEHWTVTLFDRNTGVTIDMRSQESYGIRLDGDEIGSADGLDLQMGRLAPRFSIQISDPNRAVTPPPAESWIPTTPELAQNYPNPFNPETTIRFLVPETSHVRLEVFNILGRRVAVLADRSETEGWHEVRWFAGSSLSSGLYIYRLNVAGHVLTQYMILQK